MKFIKNIAVFSVAFLTLWACTDYVDYDPAENYEITADVYFNSKNE